MISINQSFLFPLQRQIHLDLSPLSSAAITSLRGQLSASQSVSGGVIPLHETPLFTYSLRGLSGAFLRLCRRLNIDNLHFHDLRHEATSRLFEKGLNPVEVATITGRKDTRMLMRYTHLKQRIWWRGWVSYCQHPTTTVNLSAFSAMSGNFSFLPI